MTSEEAQKHRHFMMTAINAAKMAMGVASHNPCVGAVAVYKGNVIASAVTAQNGRPHAEEVILSTLQNIRKHVSMKEVTLYITLEPCNHVSSSGSTSCAQKIIQSEIKKVVFAVQDSDKRTNGQGRQAMVSAGINVVSGICEQEARKIHLGFLLRVTDSRPEVTAKVATSINAKIYDKNSMSNKISSTKVISYTNSLRVKYGGILVGCNTLLVDNPSLNCRTMGRESYSPVKFILCGANAHKVDLSYKIFHCDGKVVLLTHKDAKIRKDVLQKVDIRHCEPAITSSKMVGLGQKIDILNALKTVAQDYKVNNLLVEGGANVLSQFFSQNLVDNFMHIISPVIIYNGIDFLGVAENLQQSKLALEETRVVDNHVINFYSKALNGTQ